MVFDEIPSDNIMAVTGVNFGVIDLYLITQKYESCIQNVMVYIYARVC